MSTSMPASVLTCTQCGGELHPDEGQIFVTCPFCTSTVYLDKSQVVFHWYLAPTLDEAKARGSLARWMGGNQTVKDLDKKSQVSEQSFAYFPLWYVKYQSGNGQEEIRQFPAAATSITEIRRIKVPAGDLRKFDDSIQPQSQSPSVPLETALGWLGERGISREQILELAMVHVPLYFFKYNYQGTLYSAVVDGATGEVFANIFPAKSESPFRIIGTSAALIFLCLATFPVAGSLIDSVGGLGIGFLVCTGLGIIAAPILFAIAAWVAAKI
jgi:hypothetical protein